MSPAPVSRGTAWKIVLTVVVVVTGVGSLLFASTKQDAEFYKHVDEVMAQPDHWRGKKLQVHGHVRPDSITRSKDGFTYRFKLETKAPRQAAVIDVEYQGLVPDTFRDGAELVAYGGLDGTMLRSRQLSTKCPSHYEANKAAGVAQQGEYRAQ